MMLMTMICLLRQRKLKMSLIKTWLLQNEDEDMGIAYFLLRDDDWTVGKDINEFAKDLELSTHLTCTDYIYYEDKDHDAHYIA